MPKLNTPSQGQRYTWQNFRSAAREVTQVMACAMHDTPALDVAIWTLSAEILSISSSIVANFAHASYAPMVFVGSFAAGVATIMTVPRRHQRPSPTLVEQSRAARPMAYRLGTATSAVVGAVAGGAAGALAKLVL